MPGRINGFSISYCVIGGIVLWSGIVGSTINDALKDIMSGKPVTSDGSEDIGTPSTDTGSSTDVASSNQNYLVIGQYLMQNGYTASGAAGVVGCIAGESGGNPESVEDSSDPGSGGEGLIQWTPGSAYDVPITGNATQDLDAQLPMIIAYNDAQGQNLVQMLNSFPETAQGAVQAADFYSQYFERPASTDSDVVPSVAESVFESLSGSSGASTSTGTSSKTSTGYQEYLNG